MKPCKDILASLPGLPTIQFLIASSKIWTVGRPGNEARDIPGISDPVSFSDTVQKCGEKIDKPQGLQFCLRVAYSIAIGFLAVY